MKDKRYRTTADGDLFDTNKGRTIKVVSFDVKRSGRITVVEIVDGEGKTHRVARYAIDEKEFSFGPDGQTEQKVGESADPKPSRQNSEGAIAFTRQELLDVHHALQSAADVTLKKIVASLV